MKRSKSTTYRMRRVALAVLACVLFAPAAFADSCCLNNGCVNLNLNNCTAAGGVWLGDYDCPANGYCYEKQPRQGEQRLNRFQYLGSHNSYARSGPDAVQVPLNIQLDYSGLRHLELDIRMQNGEYRIHHFCTDSVGKNSLEAELQEMVVSQAMRDSFVVVNLDINPCANGVGFQCFEVMPGAACATNPSSREQWKNEIEDRFRAAFNGEPGISDDAIYTVEEFLEIDDEKLPSVQELLRRGRHVMFLGGQFNYRHEPFFFDHAELSMDSTREVEIRDSDHNASYVLDHGDGRFSTYFPVAQSCGAELFAQWNTAVENGYTFPTTYCVFDEDRLLDVRMHPQIPTYLVPSESNLAEIGTLLAPFQAGAGLDSALSRISLHETANGPSCIPLHMQQGTYVLPGNGPYVLDQTIRIEGKDGLVTITSN